MPYEVVFATRAKQQLRALRATERLTIIDQCVRLLSANPTMTSKARLKKLTGSVWPPYRLRVGDYRVFYDIDEQSRQVLIHGVVPKARADEWLASMQKEKSDEDDITG